jgi:uncharacterized protein (DUF1501 family)
MNENEHTDCGCREYNELSRRRFIQGSAGAAVLSVMMPEWLPRVVLAKSQVSARDIIVNIFLRGGTDSLSLVSPYQDNAYYAARPTIAIPRPGQTNGGTALDNTFQFAPAMGGLLPAYTAGELLVVHGAGLSYSSRSHFDAQRFIEVGKAADVSVNTGWLGRHLATSDYMKAGSILRGLSMTGGVPDTLEGAPATLPIPDPTNYNIAGSGTSRNERTAFIAQDFFLDQEPTRSSALNATATLALLKSLNIGTYVPASGAVYPNSSFGRSLRSAAALIKADVGVEAIHVDIGGWDTHTQAGPIAGQMANLMRDLSNSIGAFWADVLKGNGTYNVTLVAMSEFGRNVKENADLGTDHGRGGAMFVMGHQINGGRVLVKNWSTLDIANLQDRQDVKVTIDHRDILAEIAKNRLANNNLDVIFPGYVPTFQGVTK